MQGGRDLWATVPAASRSASMTPVPCATTGRCRQRSGVYWPIWGIRLSQCRIRKTGRCAAAKAVRWDVSIPALPRSGQVCVAGRRKTGCWSPHAAVVWPLSTGGRRPSMSPISSIGPRWCCPAKRKEHGLLSPLGIAWSANIDSNGCCGLSDHKFDQFFQPAVERTAQVAPLLTCRSLSACIGHPACVPAKEKENRMSSQVAF